MKTNLILFAGLIFTGLTAMAQTQNCSKAQTEKEALFYRNYAVETGDRAFIGTCLEKAIQNYYSQEKITKPNLLTEQQAVIAILDSPNQNSSAAEMKAEFFENGLNADGESFLDQ